MKYNKFVGLLLIAIAVFVVGFYFYTSQTTKQSQEENQKLKKELSIEKKQKQETKEKVKRLDKQNLVQEQETIRDVAKNFLIQMYTSSPDMNDKERYEEIQKYAEKKLVDKYFGPTRKSPIVYDTKVADINVYTEKFTTMDDTYKVYGTLKQIINDSEGKEVSNRLITMEMKLKYQDNKWLVNEFTQFDENKVETTEEPSKTK